MQTAVGKKRLELIEALQGQEPTESPWPSKRNVATERLLGESR